MSWDQFATDMLDSNKHTSWEKESGGQTSCDQFRMGRKERKALFG